ncbi:metallophosphoesterase [Agromyces sp. NDB4Y10]|uniref:metallophosphoesterase family protein n=1 Tax=Agromyces sp. NDB4Y10 TaxID=1775951 RepID=UPI0012FB9710
MSDIHAGERNGEWTHVLSEPPVARRGEQPLSDLTQLVEELQLQCDYLIAPGDIANQAEALGLSYGWRRAQALARQLQAKLIAVPGNHDVVSHSPASDPRALLKNLIPTFPTGDPALDDSFWAHGWAVIEEADHRFLLIDSTADFPPFPAHASEGDAEWEEYMTTVDRGGFPETMEDEIDAYLRSSTEKLNVAVVHHHPVEHQLRSYLHDGYGPMRRGSDLIDLLSRHPLAGRWIVIHGHKHIPQLVNAVSASSNGPLVMCAASLGAKLWSPVNTVTRNQFHFVDVIADSDPQTPSIVGTVRSFTWGYGEGWHLSERTGAGLPGTSGFGCAEDFRQVGDRLIQHMDTDALEFVSYEELTAAVPQLPYMLPRDFTHLEDHLEARGFMFTRDRQQQIVQLSRRT